MKPQLHGAPAHGDGRRGPAQAPAPAPLTVADIGDEDRQASHAIALRHGRHRGARSRPPWDATRRSPAAAARSPRGLLRPLRRRRLRSAQAPPGLPRPRSRRAGAARAPPAVRRRERRGSAGLPVPPCAAAAAGAVPACPPGCAPGCAPAPGHPPCDPAAREGWLAGGRAPGIGRAAAGMRLPVTAPEGKRAQAEVRGGRAAPAAVSVGEFTARSLLGNSLFPSSPCDPND